MASAAPNRCDVRVFVNDPVTTVVRLPFAVPSSLTNSTTNSTAATGPKPAPASHPLAADRRRVDQLVLGELLRLNMAHSG